MRRTLALALLLFSCESRHGQFAVKITIHEGDKGVTLKIEGRAAEPVVAELDRAWQQLAPSLGSRKLSVDLRGVTFMDTTGRHLLAEIHDKTGAEFLADTPMTKYFAEEAVRGSRTNSR
jgi:ABC-type transporter Mla MlaB component